MDTRRHSGSIAIKRSPEELYDVVSDVTRMGGWSPVCSACWWDESSSPNSTSALRERTLGGRNGRPWPRVRLGRG